jgi:hypothetical protein
MTKIAWNAAIVLQHAMHELRVRVEVEVGWGGVIIPTPLRFST